MQFVLMSDTHEYHRDVAVPDGDVLIHAGDVTRHSFSSRTVEDFNRWLGELPHRYKIVIPGNHDYCFADPAWQRLITNAVLLINDGIELMGMKIWGTPVTSVDFGNFGGATAAERDAFYSRIPDDTDLLVSHGPPYGILDQGQDSIGHQGCHSLLAAVNRVRPMLHVFGHIHGGYGIVRSNPTLFINAAVADQHGRPVRAPHLLHFPPV